MGEKRKGEEFWKVPEKDEGRFEKHKAQGFLIELKNTMITFLGIMGGVLNTVRLFPQVYKSWTTKKTADLSGYFIFVLFLQSVFIILYGFYKPDYIILWTNVSPLVCSIILAKLKWKYR